MDEIGAQLREARMRLRLDTAEVEARTKIRAKYLRAMENEEWDLLPGEVYVRSFLRTYADFLGLDSRQLLDEFRRRHESPADHEPPPIAPPSRERRERRERTNRRRNAFRVPPWAIVLAVLVIVGGVLWLVGRGNGGGTQSAGPIPSSTHTSAHHGARHRHRHAARRKPKPKPKPKAVTLSLVPTGAVWVCLVNGAGKQLIDGQIYDTGETIPTETGRKLLLTLGNASMTLKVNGVAVPITASASAIGFRFTPSGHAALPAAEQPSCNS